MATALAADSYTFNHGRAAFHGTSAVDQAEPHLDVFELCALSTDILKASVPQSGTPRCPTTTRRHRLFADSLLCATLEFNGWLQHFALGVLMATHLSLVTVWRRWDLCGWRAAGVSAELSGSLLRVRNRTGCAARRFTE